MAHPLEQQIAQVRREARRLLGLYALGRVLALFLATLLVLGFADYLIRYDDRGIRLMASASLVVATLWAAWRFGLPALRQRWSDVEVAKRIERRIPALSNRLATSVDFLGQREDDATAGSAALRRAAILETASVAERVDFSQVLDRQPARRALRTAGILGLLAIVIAGIAPQDTRMALARLVRPLSDEAWPRFYHVVFRDPPQRLAVGQTFEVELDNSPHNRLPQEVRITYRYESASGAVEEETEAMRLLNGTMVARKENVQRPFAYRAAGGDDRTRWIRLQVLEPPRIDGLEITVVPPEYTALPRARSDKNLVAVVGSRVALKGTATKRLRAATVRQEGGGRWPVEILGEGFEFSLSAETAEPMLVEKSGPYWIELEDVEGLAGGAADRWDLRAIVDTPPSVTFERPTGNIFVTPQGAVPLDVSVKDDLAIHDIDLHYNRSDRSDVEEFTESLLRGPSNVSPRTEAQSVANGRLGEQRSLEHRWSLSPLGLQPKTLITFWATASDYLPQTGKSTLRKITIITREELDERLAQRQALVFGELQRVLELQQDARGKTRTLDIQMREVGHLEKNDLDQAQSAELNQRQVTRTLTSPGEGISAQINDFLEELANNRIDSPDLERHMTDMAGELNRLGRDHLTTIERELTSLVKAGQASLNRDGDRAQDAAESDPLLKKSLDSAGENQDQVIGSLQSMLDELAQWDSFRRFGREVAQLDRDQQEIARAAMDMAKKTLGRDVKSLDAQQQADLKKLANGQMELSRRLEKLQQQMAETAGSLGETDPLAAATIADALHQAQQQAISGGMRQASERLEKNQLGQAATDLAKASANLEEMLDILSNRREHELARLVKQLREAEQEMAKLQARQQGLRKKMQEAEKVSNPEERKRQLERLAREQKQLEEETARLGRKLERLQAQKAGKSTANAASSMAGAASAGQQGEAGEAGENAEQAQQDLEESQQAIAERRRQAEADLAREQVAKIEDSLKSLHERQARLIEETQRIDGLRSAEGTLTRVQLSTLSDLARQQRALGAEAAQLGEKLSLAEVIQLALDGSRKHMQRAAEQLNKQESGAAAQRSQDNARQRLAQLLRAFEKSAPQGEKQEQAQNSGGGDGAGQEGDGDGDYLLAQLKILRILQQDLNDRYQELVAEPTEGSAEQLVEVAQQQGQLAELTLKLAEAPAARPEDDPDKLPDVRRANPMPENRGTSPLDRRQKEF